MEQFYCPLCGKNLLYIDNCYGAPRLWICTNHDPNPSWRQTELQKVNPERYDLTDEEALGKAQVIVGAYTSYDDGIYISFDNEATHVNLDKFIFKLLKANGFPKLAEFCEKLGLWYA